MKDDTEIFGLMNQKNGDDGRGAGGGRSLNQELDLNDVSWRRALAISGEVRGSLRGGAWSRGRVQAGDGNTGLAACSGIESLMPAPRERGDGLEKRSGGPLPALEGREMRKNLSGELRSSGQRSERGGGRGPGSQGEEGFGPQGPEVMLNSE